jgi:hypothetical protein
MVAEARRAQKEIGTRARADAQPDFGAAMERMRRVRAADQPRRLRGALTATSSAWRCSWAMRASRAATRSRSGGTSLRFQEGRDRDRCARAIALPIEGIERRRAIAPNETIFNLDRATAPARRDRRGPDRLRARAGVPQARLRG